ncbi:MAG: carbohydrate ABC transporter permease [Gaiellaceae bacterium]
MIVTSRPKAARAGQYAALGLYLIFLGFPLLWMLSVSFKGPRELVELHPHLIPSHATFENYRQAWTQNGLVHSAWNSLKVATFTSLLTTLVGLPAAYVLARQKGWISRLGLGWILLSQMFPLILIIIPLFLVLRQLHLTDSHVGLVFVYMVYSLPFILWMLQSYVRGIPRDLEEAAMVDGASRLFVLRTVIAPLLAPGVVVTALFAFITAWNEFFFALVLLQTPNLTTLPLRLAQFVGIEGIVRLGPLAASALLATVPSLVLFTIIQRWLTRGLLSGAVKG